MSSLVSDPDEGREAARPTASQRDPEELRSRLETWLKSKAGDDAQVHGVELPAANGMSSETLLADASWAGRDQRLVVRVAPMPDSNPIFPEYRLDRQFDLIEHIARTTEVPLPRLWWSEPGSQALGAPFFVMARVDGQIPPDVMPYTFGSWVTDLTADEQSAMEKATIAVLGQIHTAPIDGAGLEPPRPGESPLAAHVRRLREFYDWASSGRDGAPLIERGFAWVVDHLPDESEPVLLWGDARIGNIVYDGVRPAAVLDWEMATIGPRELDLAWMIFLHRFFQDLAEMAGMDGLPDFFTRETLALEYLTATGYRPRDLDFYTLYAALIHAVVMYRVQTRAIAFGQAQAPADPDDMILHRPTLEAMLDGTYWGSIK